MEIPDHIIEAAVERWRLVAEKFGIRIVAPFQLEATNSSIRCLAFLPDFGSSNGMVIGTTIPPSFETDAQLIDSARQKKMSISFINPAAFATCGEQPFLDALEDWKYFGDPDRKPSWL